MLSKFRSWASELSIYELFEKYQKKIISPVEVTQVFLEQIQQSQKSLNAFITISAEEALAQARLSEKRYINGTPIGILDGIPYAAKDLIFTQNIPTTMGCSYYRHYLPKENAAVIEILNNCGAILLGKANTQQFAMGATGDRSFAGPTHNPYNYQKISGGSSSGSAAAVAAGLCTFALATDTGGSARVPATLCGVIGMKPTYGRVSTRGVFPASTSFDTMGIITRNATDNALVLNAIAQYDPRNPLSLKLPPENYTRMLNNSLKGTIIHIPYERVLGKTEPEIEKNFFASIRLLEAEGATIREVEFPDYTSYRQIRTQILFAEAYATHKELYEKHPEVYDPDVVSDLENGKKITAVDYIRYQESNREFSILFRNLMKPVNIMAIPATSISATDINFRGTVYVNGQPTNLYEALSRFNWFTSMSGYPAVTFPNGFSQALPTGIQFVANRCCESNLYHIIHCLEQLT